MSCVTLQQEKKLNLFKLEIVHRIIQKLTLINYTKVRHNETATSAQLPLHSRPYRKPSKSAKMNNRSQL